MKEVHLTNREAECLSYLFDGKPLKEVAIILGISCRTVESHVEMAKTKLRCSFKGELLKTAKENGFMRIHEVIAAKKNQTLAFVENVERKSDGSSTAH